MGKMPFLFLKYRLNMGSKCPPYPIRSSPAATAFSGCPSPVRK